MNTDMMKYLPLAAAIAAAALKVKDGKETLTDEQKEANKAATGTLASNIREYAEATANDGTTSEDANAFLRVYLATGGFPNGTALNYGRAVEGFRKLREAHPETWAKSSVKDAQNAMRSEEQVEKDTLREAIKPYLRDANKEQLESVLEACKASGIKLKERKTRKDKGVVTETPEQLHEAVAEAVAA